MTALWWALWWAPLGNTDVAQLSARLQTELAPLPARMGYDAQVVVAPADQAVVVQVKIKAQLSAERSFPVPSEPSGQAALSPAAWYFVRSSLQRAFWVNTATTTETLSTPEIPTATVAQITPAVTATVAQITSLGTSTSAQTSAKIAWKSSDMSWGAALTVLQEYKVSLYAGARVAAGLAGTGWGSQFGVRVRPGVWVVGAELEQLDHSPLQALSVHRSSYLVSAGLILGSAELDGIFGVDHADVLGRTTVAASAGLAFRWRFLLSQLQIAPGNIYLTADARALWALGRRGYAQDNLTTEDSWFQPRLGLSLEWQWR